MNTEKKPTGNPNPLEHLMFKGHLGITVRVIGITIVTLAIFFLAGYYLDQLLDTKPMLMIAGIVLAFPVVQIIIFKTFRSLTNKISKDK